MNRKAYLLFGFIFIILTASSCTDKNDDTSTQRDYSTIEIIAHRGDSYYTPENTMAAVQSAWEKDADVVEIDVYLSSDNHVVALHDATTGRTGDIDLEVKKSTLEELRQVDVGSFKGAEFAGEPIPFLEDIVASIPSGKKLFIEIKGTDEAVPFIRDIVEDSGKKEQIVVIGFNLDTVVRSKELMPDVPVYWLKSAPRDDEGNALPVSLDAIATAKEHGLDGVNIHHEGLTKAFVAEGRRLDQGVYVWTVDDTAAIRRVADLGVDGITTNRIDNAQQVLGR